MRSRWPASSVPVLLAGSVRPSSRSRPHAPGSPPCGAARGMAPALGDQREGHVRQRFELAHDAVAAAMAPGAPGAAAQRVLEDAQRKLPLERLDRRVERVAHRDVHAARSVGVRAGALAAAERLVVGEARVAEREVVHRALALRAPERAEHEVGDARGGLDVARRHRSAGARVEQRSLGGAHLDRAVRAGGRRDVRVGEHAHREQARRARDRERAVEVARVLLGAAGEVQQQPLAVDRRRAGAARRSPSGASSTSSRVQLAVRQRRQAGAGATLGVVEHGVGRLAQALGSDAAGQLAQALGAGAVGGELGAQVGPALPRLAHARDELLERSRRPAAAARSRRPPRPACGCRPASSPARALPRRRGARGWRRSPSSAAARARTPA